MIRHTVMWTLKDPADAPRFKALLDPCAKLVPGMLQFEVGIREPGLEANCDVVLISAFSDAQALQAYHHHPVHEAAKAQLRTLSAGRVVLDHSSPSGDRA